jgi:hypothetical protein
VVEAVDTVFQAPTLAVAEVLVQYLQVGFRLLLFAQLVLVVQAPLAVAVAQEEMELQLLMQH